MSCIINDNNKELLFEKEGFRSTGMKLFYLGKRINTCKEQNIESDNEFGFTIHIRYSKENGSSLFRKSLNNTIHNYTQVHYGYTEMGSVMPLTKIAFESDIRGTGLNYKIQEIESVEIELADELYDKNYTFALL